MNVQCSSSRSFAKETESLDQLSVIIKADPLRTTWEVAEEFGFDHSMVNKHLKQIGKVKKLNKWVPHELTRYPKKKNVTLKCCLPLFYTTVCNVGDQGSIPGLGRSSEGGHGNPLQYSCLKNPHGQRILAGCSPWGRKESDTTKQLSIA